MLSEKGLGLPILANTCKDIAESTGSYTDDSCKGHKASSVQWGPVEITDQCKSVMIFTNGAICGGSVRFGACAAVLIPLTESQEIQVATRAVGISCLLYTSDAADE